MRIGLDMLAVQSPFTRWGGVGRLGRQLASALLEHAPEHDYLFYGYEGLPTDLIPDDGRAPLTLLRRDPTRGETTLHDAVDRLVRVNPDGLDLYLLLNPIDLFEGFAPPAKPLNGLKLGAYLHDAIPFLFQEQYLPDPGYAVPAYRSLERLTRYDVLLSCSESTGADFSRLLGLPAGRVVTVLGATEEGVFFPEPEGAEPGPAADLLRGLGVDRPFVFNHGDMHELHDRKNLFGLIDAFGRLPEPLARTHQLVIGGPMHDAFMQRLRRAAAERGVEGQLVLTNQLSEPALRALYQRCAAFAFPSFYEGLSLPLLEAMRCGAAVVAGNNSSMPEQVGDGGLLALAHDATDVAAKLARVLTEPGLARSLGRRAAVQAGRFTPSGLARRTAEAVAAAPVATPPRSRPRRTRAPRPRIAVFSPFPPKASGISDYACSLVGELRADYSIDLYHDSGYVPEPSLASPEFGCFDHRLFERRAALVGYRSVVYQMGNSVYHRFIYDRLMARPGLVTLHDFNVSGFLYWYSRLPGVPADFFRREIEHFDPERAPEVIANLPGWVEQPGGVPAACARLGLYLNRRIIEQAEAVVVHAAWCRDVVGRLFPEHLGKTVVVPFGSRAEVVPAARREAVRARFDLPREALLFGSFGFLSRGKMNVEAIEAFAAVAAEFPASMFLFVGQDWEDGAARRAAERLGLASRVRFLGRLPAADFVELTGAVDVGIGLRRPPTDGETSAALMDLLRVGVPTVVTDVGTFSGFPDTVVRKVRWPDAGIDGLSRAMRELAADPGLREALGRSARAYVAEHHSWAGSAALYARLIEGRPAAQADRHRGLPAPHFRRSGITSGPALAG